MVLSFSEPAAIRLIGVHIQHYGTLRLHRLLRAEREACPSTNGRNDSRTGLQASKTVGCRGCANFKERTSGKGQHLLAAEWLPKTWKRVGRTAVWMVAELKARKVRGGIDSAPYKSTTNGVHVSKGVQGSRCSVRVTGRGNGCSSTATRLRSKTEITPRRDIRRCIDSRRFTSTLGGLGNSRSGHVG